MSRLALHGRIMGGRSGAGRQKEKIAALVNIPIDVMFPGCDICIKLHMESWDHLFLVGACVRDILWP